MGVWLLHGLRVRSEVALGGNAIVDSGFDVDLVWERDSPIPDIAPPGRVLLEHFEEGLLQLITVENAEGYVLRIPRHCEFRIDRDLRLVTCESDPSHGRLFAAILASGLLMAVLLQLRGQLVLHASAVELRNEAVAFVAPSGGGKSTVAATLCATGARLVSDDLLRLDLETPVICYPGGPALRLRATATSVSSLFRRRSITPTADGRLALKPRSRCDRPLRLSAIILMLRPPIGSPSLRALTPIVAVPGLAACPRVIGWSAPEIRCHQFGQYVELVSKIPVFELTLPWKDPGDLAMGTTLLGMLKSM